MTSSTSIFIMLISLGVMLLFVAIFMLVTKMQKQGKTVTDIKVKGKNQQSEQEYEYKKNKAADIKKQDVFSFMEFDRIQDDMVIQNNETKFTAIIKCKGINYNLMSEVEQLAVEEGFINFLNTLRFPIQLYVQAQTIDLKENLNRYRNNIKEFMDEYDDMNTEYNMLINSLESTDQEIDAAEMKKNSALNVVEYGQDIVKYVERLSTNKNMLQRNFYVLCSYYKSEISGASEFKKEELLDICYSELFTRVQTIMSGLSMCSVSSEIVRSNDIAELLYSSYNRDDHNYINFKEAINSGFHRLYSTSEDAITKKNKMLFENIRKDAEKKAVDAIIRAIEDNTIVTEEDIEDNYEQQVSKQAIELVKKEKIEDKIKEKAKKNIINDYKEGKQDRLERKDQRIDLELIKHGKKVDNIEQSEINTKETENDTANVEETENDNENSTTNEEDLIV